MKTFDTGRQHQQERKGNGMLTNLEVTLADMYNGKTAEVSPLHVVWFQLGWN